MDDTGTNEENGTRGVFTFDRDSWAAYQHRMPFGPKLGKFILILIYLGAVS